MPRGGYGFKDLTGKRFGSLVVVRLATEDEKHGTTKRSHAGAQWLCHCDCGVDKIIRSSCLLRTRNPQKNCGDTLKHPRSNYRDLVGKTFKGLYVLGVADKKDWKYNQKSWICICECGKERIATTAELVNGLASSCGCGAYKTRKMIVTRFGGIAKNGKSDNNSDRPGSF